MGFHVVDYSASHYGASLPPQRQGKFIVCWNGDERHAVFAPKGLHAYHAHIAQRFLGDQGVEGQYDEERNTYVFTLHTWKIEGGGKWRLDEDAGVLSVFGESMAYGSVDLEDLARSLAAADAFGGVRVVVGA